MWKEMNPVDRDKAKDFFKCDFGTILKKPSSGFQDQICHQMFKLILIINAPYFYLLAEHEALAMTDSRTAPIIFFPTEGIEKVLVTVNFKRVCFATIEKNILYWRKPQSEPI